MVSFFTNKISPKRTIILDIQSDLVKGALIENHKENTGMNSPRILSVMSKSIPNSLTPSDSVRILKKILNLAHEIVSHLVKISGHHNIANIHYILSSPWILSELRTIKIKYDSDKKITREIIDEMINREIENIPAKFDAYVFEKKIFEIKLNGYSVIMYEGRSAHTLEVSFSSSFGSKRFMDNLKHEIDRVIHIHKHSFHSALLTQYISLGNIFSSKKEYIYMHIHGELTDIVVVKDGLCRHISSFPCGVKTLLRKLAHETGDSIESADSLLILYQNNKLRESEKKKSQKIIELLLSDWIQMCLKSFRNSFDIIHIPKTVFLSTHSHFDLFKNAFLLQSEINFEIISYEDKVGSDQNTLLDMYTHTLGFML